MEIFLFQGVGSSWSGDVTVLDPEHLYFPTQSTGLPSQHMISNLFKFGSKYINSNSVCVKESSKLYSTRISLQVANFQSTAVRYQGKSAP